MGVFSEETINLEEKTSLVLSIKLFSYALKMKFCLVAEVIG